MSSVNAKLSWDDLRIIHAIGTNGALSTAAQALGINCSTISRRLSKAEEVLDVKLFERRRGRYIATAQGNEIIELADRMELDIVAVTRLISSNDSSCSGEIRISTSDYVLGYFLNSVIAAFNTKNPAISVEVMVGNTSLNIARGECDVAIRASDKPPENLFGRKVATIAWALYDALPDHPSLALVSQARGRRPWISYGGQLAGLRAGRFVEKHVHPGDICCRTDSIVGAAAAIASGLGRGYLPCMVGDFHPNIRRAGPIECSLNEDLWLLTHPDIRTSPRICAFMAHCIEVISKYRGSIEGLQPSSGFRSTVLRS